MHLPPTLVQTVRHSPSLACLHCLQCLRSAARFPSPALPSYHPWLHSVYMLVVITGPAHLHRLARKRCAARHQQLVLCRNVRVALHVAGLPARTGYSVQHVLAPTEKRARHRLRGRGAAERDDATRQADGEDDDATRQNGDDDAQRRGRRRPQRQRAPGRPSFRGKRRWGQRRRRLTRRARGPRG